jgi:hypothetical protein
MWPFNGRHARFWGFTFFGIAMALLVLGLIPGWGITAEISFVGIAVLSIWFLSWLVWAMVTGRVGLIHDRPTARRQRRLERRAAARAQAEALVQQERLEAALQHGPYRSDTSVPPDSGERARARRELLDAVERHGALSPQARAAAENAKRRNLG